MSDAVTTSLDEMRLVRTGYARCLPDGGDVSVELVAEVAQDGGGSCDSELLVIWTDETLAKLADLEFGMEELVGAQEAIEAAYWESEREECRHSNLRQRGIEPSPRATDEQLRFVAVSVLSQRESQGAA